MRRLLTAAILALSLMAVGCASRGPLTWAPPGDLIATVMSTPSARTVQASGTIQVTSPEGVHSGGLLLFYKCPDSVKVLIQIGFGTTVAEVAMTNTDGIAYFPQQREAYVIDPGAALAIGTATVYPALLARLMSPVTAEDINDVTTTVVTGERYYYLRDESASGVRTWKINGRTRDLEGEDFDAAESTIRWSRSFAIHRNRRVPSFFSVTFGETIMTVHLNRIDVAPEWKSNPFSVRLPENLEPIRMGSY